MIIDYDGSEYEFELEDITLPQATRIFKAYNMSLLELEVGMQMGNPNALRAAYWVMLDQNGDKRPLDRLSFKPVKFARALNAAIKAETEAQEEDEDSPKDDTDSQA
jgi:phage tail tube protein FII